MEIDLLSLVLLCLISFGLGCLAYWSYSVAKIGGYHHLARQILKKAEVEAEHLKKESELDFKQKTFEKKQELAKEREKMQKKFEKEDERLKKREDLLESRLATLEKKESRAQSIEASLEKEKKGVDEYHRQLMEKLSQLSQLQPSEAKKLFLEEIACEVKQEAEAFLIAKEKELKAECNRLAGSILSTAIQRLAVPSITESSVLSIPLHSEEIKGRIIGKEGRNIKAFEKLTGVSVMMDDTPGAIVLSCFDPIRKQIAKTAFQSLLKDGKFYPSRIEEIVEKAEQEVEKQVIHFGENAAGRASALDLHPELIRHLGVLNFRTSLGQNILEHSLEVSHLMGLMAAELGLDVRLAKRIGLLHDIGKAVSHEVEGSHAIVGSEIAERFGESPEVVNGIACHHTEISPSTLEGSLCGPADAISASRPGARVEAIEEFIKRQKLLEEIALAFPGVDRAYVLQACRELIVSVVPEKVDDQGIEYLARKIAARIEEELKFPGKIRVSVIRETRSTQYAL